jgi:hypothetical protein
MSRLSFEYVEAVAQSQGLRLHREPGGPISYTLTLKDPEGTWLSNGTLTSCYDFLKGWKAHRYFTELRPADAVARAKEAAASRA